MWVTPDGTVYLYPPWEDPPGTPHEYIQFIDHEPPECGGIFVNPKPCLPTSPFNGVNNFLNDQAERDLKKAQAANEQADAELKKEIAKDIREKRNREKWGL